MLLLGAVVPGIPRHHRASAASLERLEATSSGPELEFERAPKKDAVVPVAGLVDVHVCSALPLLEKKTAPCALSHVEDEVGCTLHVLQQASGHEAVLLNNLYGVMLLSQSAEGDDLMRLKAFQLMSKDFDSGSWLTNFMAGKSSEFGQKALEVAGGVVGCIAEIAKAAAGALERVEATDAVIGADGLASSAAYGVDLPATLEEYEAQLLERGRTDGRSATDGDSSGCTLLLIKIAQAIVNAMGWNSYDDWRIKAEMELISTYLEELQLIMARATPTRSSDTTIKQVLCTLTLYKTYWQYRSEEEPQLITLDGHKFRPTLGLTRVKQSSTQSTATEYLAGDGDMAEMVDEMLDQLNRNTQNLRQALQALILRSTLPDPTPQQQANYQAMKEAMEAKMAKQAEAAKETAIELDAKAIIERKNLIIEAFMDSGPEFIEVFLPDKDGRVSEEVEELIESKAELCKTIDSQLAVILEQNPKGIGTIKQTNLDRWWVSVQRMACGLKKGDRTTSCDFDGRDVMEALSKGREGKEPDYKLRWASKKTYISSPYPATAAIEEAWKTISEKRCEPLIKYAELMSHSVRAEEDA